MTRRRNPAVDYEESVPLDAMGEAVWDASVGLERECAKLRRLLVDRAWDGSGPWRVTAALARAVAATVRGLAPWARQGRNPGVVQNLRFAWEQAEAMLEQARRLADPAAVAWWSHRAPPTALASIRAEQYAAQAEAEAASVREELGFGRLPYAAGKPLSDALYSLDYAAQRLGVDREAGHIALARRAIAAAVQLGR